MINQIYYWDEYLSQHEYNSIENEFEKYNWVFTAGEDDEKYPKVRTFWYKELIESTLIENIFKQKVEQLLNVKIETSRLYGNGQSTGQSAWPHVDVSDDIDGDWGSVVYYLHKNWKPIYGGHLIFLNNTWDSVTNSFFPKTNSAVLFDSKLDHCALEPTVYCQDMRISIAYKFKVLK